MAHLVASVFAQSAVTAHSHAFSLFVCLHIAFDSADVILIYDTHVMQLKGSNKKMSFLQFATVVARRGLEKTPGLTVDSLKVKPGWVRCVCMCVWQQQQQRQVGLRVPALLPPTQPDFDAEQTRTCACGSTSW
jgi:hypothetical protein